MGVNKRLKKGPLARPPPVAAVKGNDGTFTNMQGERELFVCDTNMVVGMAWSWGEGETFEAGTVPARLAQFVGEETDKYSKWRPDAVLIVGFDGMSLKQVDGYATVLSVKQRQILEDNSDVYVDSNLGLRVSSESITTAHQIVLLVPDANGDYDVGAARSRVKRGANYSLLLGTVTLKLVGNKKPTKIQAFQACTAGDDLSSMLHSKWHDEWGRPDPALFKPATPATGGRMPRPRAARRAWHRLRRRSPASPSGGRSRSSRCTR